MENTEKRRLAVIALSATFLCCTAAGTTVGLAVRSVNAEEGAALPDPIARYLFDDETDVGKDSVGDYGMEIVGGKNAYTKVNGGIEFNGGFVLAQKQDKNIFRDVTEFTMCFEYKMLPENGAWNSIMGVSDVGGGNYMFLDSSGGDTRFHASNATKDGNATIGTYWDGAQLQCSSYTRITITVKPGGQINVYINGALSTSENKIPADIPADWTLYNSADDQCRFAIGAPVNNRGDIGTTGKAGVKELVFYNKEFSAAEVTQYWADYEAAHAKVTSAEYDFSDSITVAAAASNAHVLKYAQNGTYEVTMSDGTKLNANVTWTGVVDRDGAKYLEGAISGVNNPDGVKAYGKINAITTKVVSAEVDSGAVFPATATNEQIMGAVKDGEYEVTLEDGGKLTAVVTWTGVREEGGRKYIEGTLAEVNNPDNVKAKGSVTVGERALVPFAHYDFADASQAGKDSAGNYDLLATGNPVVSNGEITFDGESRLVVKNSFTSKLKSYSLSYQVKAPTGQSSWAGPIGLGADMSGGKEQWLVFNMQGGNDNLLRFSFSDRKQDGKGNITGQGDEAWGIELGNVTEDAFVKVTLTVEVGGKCRVYFNGVLKGTFDVPADFALTSSKLKLTLGSYESPYNGYRNFKGTLKDVRLYDCALTPGQVGALEMFGDTYPHDGSLYIVSVNNDALTFDGDKITNKPLYDNMNEQTMLSAVNKATVTAALSDGTTKTAEVFWNAVKEENGTYYAFGSIAAVGAGATVAPRAEIKQELKVYKILDVETAENLTGGAISSDKAKAYAGIVVNLTVTPEAGYEIETVTVNGTPIEAVEGKYFYTVLATDTRLQCSATFRKVFAVSCETAANGTISADRQTAHVGDVIELTITPAEESELVSVLLNGEPLEAVAGAYRYTVTDESPATLVFSATFRKMMSIVCEAGEHGTLTADKETAALGDEIVLTITPASGYAVGQVKINGKTLEAVEGVYEYVVGADDAALSFTATFVKRITVTIETAENGTVTADKQTGTAGDTITLTVTPAEGYEIEYVKVNGKAIEAENGVYRFVAEDDSTVNAAFKLKQTAPVDPVEPKPEKKGCNSSGEGLIAALTAAIAVAAVTVAVKKGRKNG